MANNISWVNEDLQSVYDWCVGNELVLNSDKCLLSFIMGDPIRASGSFFEIKRIKINLIIENCICDVSSVYDI